MSSRPMMAQPGVSEMTKLVAVKFLKSHDRYNAKEVAGFEPRIAELLIVQGIAKEYDAAAEAAEAQAAEAEADELAARAADLDAREAALAAREAALVSDPIKGGDLPKQGGADPKK
jgi:hypothetical protein